MTGRFRHLRTAAGLLAAVATLTAQPGSAQPGRQTYRDAFQSWRQGDPDLERDAATNTDLSSRTGTAAAAAARYATARAASLRAAMTEANKSMEWLNTARLTPEPDLAPAMDLQRLVAGSTEQVTKQIGIYADDSDPALQPVRQALARERSALLALSGAISERQAAVTKAAGAFVAVEQARVRAIEPHQAIVGALQNTASGLEQETLAWAEYYRLVAEGTRGAVAATPAGATPSITPSAPVSTTGTAPATAPLPDPSPPNGTSPDAVTTGGVRINNPARNSPSAPVSAPVSPEVSDPAPSAAVRINSPAGSSTPRVNNPAAAPVVSSSMNRFVGSWTFPMGGLYHGPQPDVADFEVKEDGGNLTGTLNARFWPFADIKAVTTVRFEFSGTFGTARVQSFPLVTSDGAKGSIDLIPGPAFNLLEINFYTDRVPGKLSRGNLLLIRK